METNRTISVVKHVVSRPSSLQNGPFLEQRAHLGGWAREGGVTVAAVGLRLTMR